MAVAKGEPEQSTGTGSDMANTPVAQVTSTVTTNVLPGLRLSVVGTGLRLPAQGGDTSLESQ